MEHASPVQQQQQQVDEHEFNYMPSNWSKRYGPMEMLARYFKFCSEVTSEARRSTAHERDIAYGPSERARYDVYGTDLPDDAPIFLFVHGGYWSEFSKDQSGFVVPVLVRAGVKVIVAGYDLCPRVKLAQIVQQIKSLTEKVLTRARALGSKCVWLGGHSAGAHLAASLLHDSEWLERATGGRDRPRLLRGILLIAGLYDLEPLLRVSVNESLGLTAEEIKSYSFAPIDESKTLDDKPESIRDVKVIVAVGECDSPVFIEESRRYARKLTRLVDRVEFLLIRDDTDHFDIVEKLTSNEYVLSRALIGAIKGCD